jgi:hypothetical protein
MRLTHEAWVVAGFDRPLTARARLYMRHNAEEGGSVALLCMSHLSNHVQPLLPAPDFVEPMKTKLAVSMRSREVLRESKFAGLVANENDLGKRFDDEIVSPKGAIFFGKTLKLRCSQSLVIK